ncbi:hypothetical protein BP5796_12685 [Coleophoma crateriformis]|uniref:Fungal N-terminal domain-containing protein n=1 Tax=Coleophoma crateriformis TaxID=565419 RepID=A0A3D8Q5W0_9HELO|nr:hypothetical protein BP5796_12685 [Coleophoma crateriformis]
MADILSTVSAASALLEQAIGIIVRLRTANERDKDLKSVLESHNVVLENTKAIIELIKAEAALQTAAVGHFLTDVNVAMSNLVRLLKVLDPGDKSWLRRFIHQLVEGSKDEKALADGMQKLDRAKSDLGLCLQVASVGLKQTPDSGLAADAEMIKRISTLLEEVLGSGNGLKIAKLIQNRDGGNVPLSACDIELLNKEGEAGVGNYKYSTVQDEGKLGTSRIIVDNLTEDQARMINGSIGEDVWKEVAHLEIRGNTAKGESEMFNYGMDLDTYHKLQEEKRADQAAKRVDRERAHRMLLQQGGMGLGVMVVVWILVKLSF